MKAEKNPSNGKERVDDTEDAEALEIVLFQVSECYVYMVITLFITSKSPPISHLDSGILMRTYSLISELNLWN